MYYVWHFEKYVSGKKKDIKYALYTVYFFTVHSNVQMERKKRTIINSLWLGKPYRNSFETENTVKMRVCKSIMDNYMLLSVRQHIFIYITANIMH